MIDALRDTQTLDRPSVFDYEDFISFLEAMVFYLKVEHKVTKSEIVKRAGFKSPSYLKMLMDGQRKPTIQTAQNLAKALHLTKDETQYFCLMLKLTQSQGQEQEKVYRRALDDFKNYFEVKEIDPDSYQLFHNWYTTVILEFIGCYSEAWSVSSLAKALRLKQSEVQDALDCLERLGLVEQEDGSYAKTGASLQTPKHAASKILHQYTRAMLDQATDKLSEKDQDKRHFQTLTLSLTQEQYRQVKDRIWKVMEDINSELHPRPDAKGVYQFNIQLFSLLDFDDLKS